MFVIVVYDIEGKRVTKIHKYLKKRLHWVQNSVFEGEIKESQYVIMKNDLKKFIKKNKKDMIVIYKFLTKQYFERTLLGKAKNKITNII